MSLLNVCICFLLLFSVWLSGLLFPSGFISTLKQKFQSSKYFFSRDWKIGSKMDVNSPARGLFIFYWKSIICKKWKFFSKKFGVQGSKIDWKKNYIYWQSIICELKNHKKTTTKKFFAFNLKDSKPYLSVFSFTFLQSEDIKTLKNNALIIFEKIGEGIYPGADSIRALRPDFQVPFLAFDFFVQSSSLLSGIICSKHGSFVEQVHANECRQTIQDYVRWLLQSDESKCYRVPALWITQLRRSNDAEVMLWRVKQFLHLHIQSYIEFCMLTPYRIFCRNFYLVSSRRKSRIYNLFPATIHIFAVSKPVYNS